MLPTFSLIPQPRTYSNPDNPYLFTIPQMASLSLTVEGASAMDAATQLATVESLASGALEANFYDTRFKSKVPHAHNTSAEHALCGHTIPVVISWVGVWQAPESTLETVTILALGSGPDRDRAVHRGRSVAEGVIFAKKMVVAPANVLTPGDRHSHRFIIV